MKKIIRGRIYKTVKCKDKNKSSIELLGCSIDFYKEWLNFQFDEYMNWENYGSYWNIDHVTPCNSFDLSKKENQLICFNWKNTRPMLSSKNFSKCCKIDENLIKEHANLVKKYILISGNP